MLRVRFAWGPRFNIIGQNHYEISGLSKTLSEDRRERTFPNSQTESEIRGAPKLQTLITENHNEISEL